MFLKACTDPGFVASISLVKDLFEIVCILIPLFLIVLVGYDLFKIVTSQEKNIEEKRINKIIVRFVAATVVFFIPLLVNMLMTTLGTTKVMNTECWQNANATQVKILKAQRDAEIQAAKDKNNAENVAAAKVREEVNALRAEQEKKNKELAEAELKKRNQTGEMDGLVYYCQGDYPNEPYGSYGSIASHGCGPTSCAIIASTMLGKAGHTPRDTTDWICANGYCSSSGTYTEGDKKYLEYAGLKVSESMNLNSDTEEKFNDALVSGNSMIIMLAHEIGNCPFTNGGHYFVIYGMENGQYKVADPASRQRSQQTWPLSSFYACGTRQFYIVSKS